MPSKTTCSLRDLAARVPLLRCLHERRLRDSGCEFTIAARIADLSPAAWDAVTVTAPLFLRRSYLQALQDSAPDGVAFRFVLASRQGKAVAAMHFQLLTLSGAQLGAQQLACAGGAAARRLRARVVVAGNLLSWGAHALAVAPGADPALAWTALADAMYRIRRAERTGGTPALQVVKDLPADVQPKALLGLGYRPLATEPDMALDIPAAWRRLDDYGAALTAKYRKAMRTCIADVAKAGITCADRVDPAPIAAALHALYLQVHTRAAVQPITAPPGYLPALAAGLGDDFRCSVLSRDGVPVGFVTVLRDGEAGTAYLVGFDEAVNAEAPIYFRLLYQAVDQAIAMGCRRLSFGRTALDPKARLGARPAALQVWMRHRHRAVSALMRPLLALVPHAEAPERTPFKSEAG